MAHRYKVLTIVFSLDSSLSPYQIMSDIENQFKKRGCVISLKAFCGNLFMCTLCHEEVVDRMKAEKSLYVNNKEWACKVVENNIISVKIDIPFMSLGVEDLNRMLRMYGNIMLSELQEIRKRRMYYAILDLKKDLPAKLKCKFGFIDLVEIA